MGVPAFFRWLSLKYNRIVSHCIEEKGKQADDDTKIPVNTSLPNPNSTEFDNLYLDMNGIIHPCTHPENKPAPKNEEEMFVEIFLYIDRIFSVVRPRRMIYMAVDGVAPRAKMNQQRSRRFRAGKETREKTLTLARLREELTLKGARLPDPKPASEHFDSNCITPGTPFMARLALALQYYVYDKLNSDPGWANIQVVLSDASAPGEGEHKIMDYIRRQRASATHDPNTKHCLCGADADLIMLGLATHEPYFTIIREEFKPNLPRPCELCGQMDHVLSECQGLTSDTFNVGVNNSGAECEFIFIHINILREYLQHDLIMVNLPFPYDFERAIDDWVFMCFFVGNDFLPHLPSLEIREKAIDRLIELYKASVYKTKGWLTDSGKVNLERVQLIMTDLALVEDEIFKSRRNNELDFRKKSKFRRNNTKRQKLDESSFHNNRATEFIRPNLGERFSKVDAVESAKAAMGEVSSFPGKRRYNEPDKDNEDIQNEALDKRDEVKLWEGGYRTRYYQSKFGVSVIENPRFCVDVAHQYVRGLCWVLAYYYQGCPSWTWYYPYHYAPFAEDFLGVADTDVEFVADSKPFNPLEQLMGVFPADSKDHVPPAWHSLMTDSDSPVIDFYPTDFKVDLNGKRFDWQGVALLPFVDETRLLSALALYYDQLTDDEVARNVRGPDRYFVRSDHPVAAFIKVVCEQGSSDTVLDPGLVNGVTGRIWKDELAYSPGDLVKSAVKDLCDDIPDVKAISCFFQDPQFTKSFLFPATLLKDVTMPPVSLGPNALRIERENKRSFNTKPMNRMVNHALSGGQTTGPSDTGRSSHNSYEQQSRGTSHANDKPDDRGVLGRLGGKTYSDNPYLNTSNLGGGARNQQGARWQQEMGMGQGQYGNQGQREMGQGQYGNQGQREMGQGQYGNQLQSQRGGRLVPQYDGQQRNTNQGHVGNQGRQPNMGFATQPQRGGYGGSYDRHQGAEHQDQFLLGTYQGHQQGTYGQGQSSQYGQQGLYQAANSRYTQAPTQGRPQNQQQGYHYGDNPYLNDSYSSRAPRRG